MNQLSSSEKFMDLLVHHQDQLFGYIFALVQDLEDTQDVFQQTSLVLWRKYDSFDGANFAAWACRTAQLEAMSFLRTKRRARLRLGDELLRRLTDRASVADEISQARSDALQGCLNKLSPADRELIATCYSAGMTMKEVAESLERSAQSLCNSLRRIRRALFECINRTLSREGHS